MRDELRENLRRKLEAGSNLFPGIVGYEETVLPQLINAILARHDLILLGLRGQAKTRLCRQLQELLDDETPVIPGCPLRSHPLQPLGTFAEQRIAEAGNDLEIEWLPRSARYAEKLATPDVTMADLIGDIDPLKAAHRKLDLSDEEVIHFGIIPRSNRGIFNINELPDLAPRIQVGLLNILEEQDVQIRGFPVRFPLDVVMVFTANPEDYTNRGAIITPLKDRIASQILTHYPRNLDEARVITSSEAWLDRGGEVTVAPFLADICEEIAFQGRDSEYVDQTSGVSARLPIAARELLVSQIEARALRNEGTAARGRVLDLVQVIPAITGKVELVYEGEQEGPAKVARHLMGNACRVVFDRMFPDVMRDGEDAEQAGHYKPILDWFAAGNQLDLTDALTDKEYELLLSGVPGLADAVREFAPDSGDDSAALMELVLEGLHQHSMLAKEDLVTGASYSDMLGIMLEGLQ